MSKPPSETIPFPWCADMLANRGSSIVTTTAVAAVLASALSAEAQGVRGFGVLPGKLPVRGFGNPVGEDALRSQFPEAAAAIVGDDRSLARKQIALTDGNGDGLVTEEEWAESGFQSPGRFRIYDLNGDGILTVYEHSIGIARWRRGTERRADERSSQSRAAARKKEETTSPSAFVQEPPETDPQVVARREQVQLLADVVIRAYDINENGVIGRGEFQSRSAQFGNVAGADSNRDGEIGRDEMCEWLRSRLPPLSRLAVEWQEHDLDHDHQVTLREFSASVGSKPVDEFARWDLNGDGFITPRESQSLHEVSSTYENRTPFVIKPRSSTVSEIWIEDDLLVDRLQVDVRITKETDNFTALFLVGPGGRRVTLYAGDGWRPWGGGQILRGVTFHDAAPPIRTTLKQPPFRRELRPPGKGTTDEPTLSSFTGESIRGTWRLIVRNQNDRAGLLLHWSLIVTPRRASG